MRRLASLERHHCGIGVGIGFNVYHIMQVD